MNTAHETYFSSLFFCNLTFPMYIKNANDRLNIYPLGYYILFLFLLKKNTTWIRALKSMIVLHPVELKKTQRK